MGEYVISKVSVHRILKPLPDDCDERDDQKICKVLQKRLKHKWHKVNLGDLVVHVPSSGYRMNGVYIINMKNDEKAVTQLARDIDDYGTIPKNFTCPQYTPDAILDAASESDKFYWHNELVPIDIIKFEKFTYDIKQKGFVGHYRGFKYLFDITYISMFQEGVFYMEWIQNAPFDVYMLRDYRI